MRQDTSATRAATQAATKAPRYVVQIIYPTASPTFSTRLGITNLPGTVVDGAIKSIGGTSQQIVPEEGRSTIGSFDFEVVDLSEDVTDAFRYQLATNEENPRRHEVRVYRGYSDDFLDYARIGTYQLQGVELVDGGTYRVSSLDIQRQMRDKIFEQKKTRISVSMALDAATITVLDTAAFEMVAHTAAFTDAPSATVGYFRIKKTGDIVRYTGKTGTTFTGCTHGLFHTISQPVTVEGSEEDQWPEVEEFIYLEGSMPLLARTIMSGVLDDAGPTYVPDHWHLGIPEAYLRLSEFLALGADLVDDTDVSVGFPGRFTHLSATDGKRFVEQQIMVPMGCFLFVDSAGTLGPRRLARVLTNAPFVSILDESCVKTASSLVHDQESVINQVVVNWNYNGEDFTRRTPLYDTTSIARNGLADPVELELRGIAGSRHTDKTIQRIFQTYLDRNGDPPIRLTVTVLPSRDNIEVGDVVRVVQPSIRDYSGPGSLDRSFEVQSVSIDWMSGEPTLELFGTARTIAAEQPGSGTQPALPDAWYDDAPGVALSSVLTIVANAVTVSGTLTGGADARTAVFYHLGNLTINSGVVVTIDDNVQLRVRGVLTVNGTIDGKGHGGDAATDPNTVGLAEVQPSADELAVQSTFGSTRGSGGFHQVSLSGPFSTTITVNAAYPQYTRVGQPAIALQNLDATGGVLVGLPAELRGTGGNYGGALIQATVLQKGAAGGKGGGGLVIVCRGLVFGASGVIDLSGANGTAPASTTTINGIAVYPGAGGGGAPGVLFVVLDGDSVSPPDFDSVLVDHGTTPQTGTPTDLIGSAVTSPATATDPGLGALDQLGSNTRYQWLPSGSTTGDTEDETVPSPQALTATADAAGVLLKWTSPPADKYDYIEVWEATTNDRTGAILLSSRFASSLFVGKASSITRYYWIRARDDVRGYSAWYPTGSTSGVSATFGGSGSAGADAVSCSITANPSFNFLQAPDGGAWSATTTDITFTMIRAGSTVATHVIRVTRSGATLTGATFSETGEATVEDVTTGSGTSALTILITHTLSGVTFAETVMAIQGGSTGSDGADGDPGGMGWPVDAAGKPAGLRAEGISDRSQIQFGGVGVQLLSTPDTTTGMAYPAVSVDPAETYTLTVKHKSSATSTTGLYIRFAERSSALSAGTTHITGVGSNEGGVFSPYTTIPDAVTDGPMPGTTLIEQTYSYTPTAGTKFMSLIYYNWAPATAAVVYELQSARLTRPGSNENILVLGSPTIDLATQILGQLTTAFAAAGLINTNVSINADGSLTGAGGGAPVISSLTGSVATGQLTTNVLAALQAVIGNLSAIHADLGTITAGNVTLASGGYVRSPSISYDGDHGFFLGYDGGEPAFSLREGSRFFRFKPSVGYPEFSGKATFSNTPTTFTPNWVGMSGASGDLSYIDFGSYVLLWSAGNILGTSSSTTVYFDNLPSAIRPSAPMLLLGPIVDSGVEVPGRIVIGTDGTVFLYKYINDTGTRITYTTMTNGVQVGIAGGFMLTYPK